MKYKEKNPDKYHMILFFLVLLALANPHIVEKEVHGREIVPIFNYFEFSHDGRMGREYGMKNVDINSYEFECTNGVRLADHRGCDFCGRWIIEATGSGACVVTFKKTVKVLEWW